MTRDPLSEHVEFAVPKTAVVRSLDQDEDHSLNEFLDYIKLFVPVHVRVFLAARTRPEVFVLKTEHGCAVVLSDRLNEINAELVTFFSILVKTGSDARCDKLIKKFLCLRLCEFLIGLGEHSLGLATLRMASELHDHVNSDVVGSGGQSLETVQQIALSMFVLAHEIGHLQIDDRYEHIKNTHMCDGIEIVRYVERGLRECGYSDEDIANEVSRFNISHVAEEVASDVFAFDSVFGLFVDRLGIPGSLAVDRLLHAFSALLATEQCRITCLAASDRLTGEEILGSGLVLRQDLMSYIRAKFLMRRAGITWASAECGGVKTTSADFNSYVKKVDTIFAETEPVVNLVFQNLRSVEADICTLGMELLDTSVAESFLPLIVAAVRSDRSMVNTLDNVLKSQGVIRSAGEWLDSLVNRQTTTQGGD